MLSSLNGHMYTNKFTHRTDSSTYCHSEKTGNTAFISDIVSQTNITVVHFETLSDQNGCLMDACE